MTPPPRTWVLADDRPGNVGQALGVAEALGWPFEAIEIRYGPLARLPNRLLGASRAGLARGSGQRLRPPWPELVIAAGRRTAPVARWIKARAGGRCFLVQLMWPGALAGLDLVAVPEHDAPPRHPRLIITLGAPHRITRERLAKEAEILRPRVAGLPRPLIACLVGGTSRHTVFEAGDAHALGQAVSALARARGGSLLVTTSRRTGPECEQALIDSLDAPAFVHRFGQQPNAYPGLLGLAEAVVVTADSASMCSEAVASGRPVYLFTPRAGVANKLARLHRRLEELGHLAPLGAPWRDEAPPAPNPAEEVARAIRARLSAKAPPEMPAADRS